MFRKAVLLVLLSQFIINCNNTTNKLNIDTRIRSIDSIGKLFWNYLDTNPSLAESSSRWMVQESRTINYPKGEAEGLAGISIVFEKFGNYDSAIAYNLRTLEVRIQAKDTAGIFRTNVNLAKNYSRVNLRQQQLKYLLRATQSLPYVKDTANTIQLNTEYAIYYTGIEKYDSAKIGFYKALVLAREYSDQSKLSYSLENYGNVLNQLDQNDSALHYYKLCVPMYKANNAKQSLAAVYNNIAMVYWSLSKPNSVRYYLEKGYKETRLLGNKQEIEDNLINMVSFWEEQKDLKKSNTYLHELLDLRDTVFNKNLGEKIAGIEKSFEVKLEKEANAKLKSEVSRKNTLRNGALIFALLLLLLALFQYRIYSQRQKLAANEKLLKDNEIDQLLQERELKNLDALLEGRETERKRIGRDLHDRLGSILSTVKLHFSAIDERIEGLQKQNREQYTKATELLDEAVSEVRKISQDLVTGVLVKFGLSAALQDMKNTLEATGKIQINLFETGLNVRPSMDYEIALYRIVQELISNTLKHANATKVDIHLTMNETEITVIVEDNGQGFDVKKPANFGLGMANIKQRVAALGGVVSFDSRPGAGATVIVEIPHTEINPMGYDA